MCRASASAPRVRSLPFTALVCCVFAVLLALQVAIAHGLVSVAATPVAAPPSEAMAIPPKPAGLKAPAAEGGDGEGDERLTFEACTAMATGVRDVCWQALARQQSAVDPQGALGVCDQVVEPELKLECVDDVAEATTLADRAGAERICTGVVDRKWRGQCWFGVGLAWAETDSDYALGRCEHAEAFERFCRHDVVGEVSLVDVDAGVAFCTRGEAEHADDDLTRKTCWHGIAKYLARRDVGEAAAACERATASWRGTCYHGLGWGGSERDPDGTLAACAGFGPWADYCRQGVAHEQKRVDPTRALALCEAIGTTTVRARCLEFVTR